VAFNRRYYNVSDIYYNTNMTKSTSFNKPFKYYSLNKVIKDI
jgi:hypothetical protein